MTILKSKLDFLYANSVFKVQNEGTYLPRITRETCTDVFILYNRDKSLFLSVQLVHEFIPIKYQLYSNKNHSFCKWQLHTCTALQNVIPLCAFKCQKENSTERESVYSVRLLCNPFKEPVKREILKKCIVVWRPRKHYFVLLQAFITQMNQSFYQSLTHLNSNKGLI